MSHMWGDAIQNLVKQGAFNNTSNPRDLGKYIFGADIWGARDVLRGFQQQNTFMTPEQLSTLMGQLTQPAIDTLTSNFGQQQRGLASSFANRGNLFGGSLTGAQAQLGTGFQRALSNLFSNVGGQLGQTNLQLGAQRQMQANQLLNELFSQILGGEYGIAAARAGRPPGGSFGETLMGLGGLAAGGAQLWPVLTSDRNIKKNIKEADEEMVLENVERLPVYRWKYKDDSGGEHIGPMAQDFKEVFGLGDSDKLIYGVDANGVLLAAVKALKRKISALESKLDKLEAQNA